MEISPLTQIDPRARLGRNVRIGPFCLVGPNVQIGDDTILESHVTIIGNTTIGSGNRFTANSVIGGAPQDKSYCDTPTRVVIGNGNTFRDGVTVNRGAEKEDGVTSIGDRNLFMANSHVAHNCRIDNDAVLVNGVLLGGHVHVQEGAIVSGNSVVHHFSTLGRLSFVSGGCRVPHDIPPFMLAAGSDNPTLKTINIVGMRRYGIADETIRIIKSAFRMLFRKNRGPDAVRNTLGERVGDRFPPELIELLEFVKRQRQGNMGRAREAVRSGITVARGDESQQREAA